MPASAQDIVNAYGIQLHEAQSIVDVSNELGFVDPAMLANVINFESGFRPWIQNSIGATGLIQFIPPTARALGTSTDALKRMSFVEQMDWVYEFLRPYARKVKTQEDLYMAIFYPAAIGKPDFVFPGDIPAKNNGIRTPRDYAERANRKAKLRVDYGGQSPSQLGVQSNWVVRTAKNPLTYLYVGMALTIAIMAYRRSEMQSSPA